MPVTDRNTAFTAGQTKTTERYYPPPGHTQVTISLDVKGGDVNWTPYGILEGTQERFELEEGDAPPPIAVAAGARKVRTYFGTFSAIESDVENTDATAGSFTHEIQVGGVK